jgi:hypothetical protein
MRLTRYQIPKAPFYILGWAADPSAVYRTSRYIVPAASAAEAEKLKGEVEAALGTHKGSVIVSIETEKPELRKGVWYALGMPPVFRLAVSHGVREAP